MFIINGEIQGTLYLPCFCGFIHKVVWMPEGYSLEMQMEMAPSAGLMTLDLYP